MNTLINSLLLINTSCWMYDNRELLYNNTIYDISFPGTHDSGSYNINGSTYIDMPGKYSDLINIGNLLHIPVDKLIKGWAQTQHINITKQLEEGSRYLDLRIGYKNNMWFIHHDYILGYPLNDMLVQIRNFIIKNQGEVLIIELSHIINLTDENIVLLNNTINNILGEFMYKGRVFKNETIGKLVGSGQRILIMTDTILYLPSSMIYNSWANSPDIDIMIKFNNKIMEDWITRKYDILYKLSWVLTPNITTFIETIIPKYPNNLTDLEKDLGNYLDAWGNKYLDRKAIKCPIFPNIIIVDYFDKTNLLKLLISGLLNCRL